MHANMYGGILKFTPSTDDTLPDALFTFYDEDVIDKSSAAFAYIVENLPMWCNKYLDEAMAISPANETLYVRFVFSNLAGDPDDIIIKADLYTPEDVAVAAGAV